MCAPIECWRRNLNPLSCRSRRHNQNFFSAGAGSLRISLARARSTGLMGVFELEAICLPTPLTPALSRRERGPEGSSSTRRQTNCHARRVAVEVLGVGECDDRLCIASQSLVGVSLDTGALEELVHADAA